MELDYAKYSFMYNNAQISFWKWNDFLTHNIIDCLELSWGGFPVASGYDFRGKTNSSEV